MIKSMTGFGRSQADAQGRRFSIEVRAVNHRYLDVGIKTPKALHPFEGAIRSILKEYAGRGKVDLSITCDDSGSGAVRLKYDEELAGQYLSRVGEMAERFGIANDVGALALSRYPEVLSIEEGGVDEDALWASLEPAVREACEAFDESRASEGERLCSDLLGKLGAMLPKVGFIEERYPAVLSEYRARLEGKIRELVADRQLDDSRIATEAALFADRICVDEEVVRLKSHIKGMMDALGEGGAVGRKLDFIAQEMNREANTILSKTTDLSITNAGIDLKTDIEKVREQVQNIE